MAGKPARLGSQQGWEANKAGKSTELGSQQGWEASKSLNHCRWVYNKLLTSEVQLQHGLALVSVWLQPILEKRDCTQEKNTLSDRVVKALSSSAEMVVEDMLFFIMSFWNQ